MKRRSVPQIGMIRYREHDADSSGFVAVPLIRSMDIDPMRAHPHTHDFFQVSLLVGSGHLMHDFRETDFSGVTLFFLSPGQVHAVERRPELDGWIVSFTRDFFEADGESAVGALLDLPFFFAGEVNPWLSLGKADGEIAQRLFREMQDEYDAAMLGNTDIARSLLRILLIRASRWYVQENAVAKITRGAALVRKFQHLVERHYVDWNSLEPYARELGVTVNHLNDVVREELGAAAGEMIRQRRLLDAKRLLLHSSMSVSEICFHLGFKDPSYFGRFFRRYENRSPAEFRKEIREKYQNPGS